MTFDPGLRRLARVLPRSVVGPTDAPGDPRADEAPSPSHGGEVVRVGDIDVRLHRPERPMAGPGPALLWIHGGGFVMGTAAQDDRFCRAVSSALGVIVAAVDYRLAPEHPFPVPLDDCHDALVWLARHPEVDRERIAIGGASAGGGLAAALALLARNRGEVRPAFQLLTYPMLDDRTATRPDIDEREHRLWDSKSNLFGWWSYLGTVPGADATLGARRPSVSREPVRAAAGVDRCRVARSVRGGGHRLRPTPS